MEIEFGRLDAALAADAVFRRFGGTVEPQGPHRLRISGTELGDFTVELDWGWVHGTADDGGLVDKAKAILGGIGREVVPSEIVAPPVPAERLAEIDTLVGDLAALGAEGTRTALLNGFGLHLNPELGPADLAAGPIRCVLQAYLLEAPALRAEIGVDPMRSLLPFVEAFPQTYRDRVLDPDYDPPLATLIDDYLALNPTRNRELDLLPLFAHLDGDRVARALADPRISARPTWHWRLPNADIEAAGWSVVGEWQRWLRVETLALDTRLLAERVAEAARAAAPRKGAWASLF